MEDAVIREFISVGYGSGDGNGYGYKDDYGSGYGAGTGTGSGSGFEGGYGYGYGLIYEDDEYDSDGDYEDDDEDGTGFGHDNGYEVKEFNHQRVYLIDGVETLIDSVHGDYAKGKILLVDLTTTECYIARCGDYFVHGDTPEQARSEAQDKYNENRPIEERIADFIKQYPSPDSMAEHIDLYHWHRVLTGSRSFGREIGHGLSTTEGTITIRDFLELMKDAYGGDVIRMVMNEYN